MRSTMVEKLASRWAGLRTGHEAVMMEDARAVLAAERGRVNETDRPEAMGDLHVGDVYHEAQKPTPQVSTLAKLAIGGALLASGVGAGVAIPLLLDVNKAQPTIEQSEHVDTNTQYRLEFGVPQPKGGSSN